MNVPRQTISRRYLILKVIGLILQPQPEVLYVTPFFQDHHRKRYKAKTEDPTLRIHELLKAGPPPLLGWAMQE